MATQSKIKTQPVNVTGLNGVLVAVLDPLESTDVFCPTAFSDDLDQFPYTPVLISQDGCEYAHCGCQTEEQAMRVIHESCFGTEAVFLLLMERQEIKHGWILRWLEQ
jgi:hypothetical protein